MRKIHLLFIILLFTINCKKGVKEKTVNKMSDIDKETYALINQIINQPLESSSYSLDNVEDKLEMHFPLDYKIDSLQITKLDTILSKEDMEFMFNQMKRKTTFKLEKKFIQKKIVISSDTLQKIIEANYKAKASKSELWKMYENKYGKTGFYSIGQPYFSKDMKIAIIKVSTQYFGMSSGECFIYRKVNGIWKFIKSTSTWIA